MLKVMHLGINHPMLNVHLLSFIFYLFTDYRSLITDYFLPFTVHCSPFTFFLYLLSFIFSFHQHHLDSFLNTA
jgi:hypothetical protein